MYGCYANDDDYDEDEDDDGANISIRIGLWFLVSVFKINIEIGFDQYVLYWVYFLKVLLPFHFNFKAFDWNFHDSTSFCKTCFH